MNFEQYIADFNTGDDERLVEKYYHPDIIFTGSTRKLHGQTGTDRLPALGPQRHPRNHPRPKLRPAGNKLFAEIDMDFHASKDRPAEFPFKALRAGEMA